MVAPILLTTAVRVITLYLATQDYVLAISVALIVEDGEAGINYHAREMESE